MATRGGKKNPVESKIGALTPRMRIARTGGQVKVTSGKVTRRGDSQR